MSLQKFQLPDGTPDWSKAPADAQFYHPDDSEVFECFFKLDGKGGVLFVSDNYGMKTWKEDEYGDEAMMRALSNLVEKP